MRPIGLVGCYLVSKIVLFTKMQAILLAVIFLQVISLINFRLIVVLQITWISIQNGGELHKPLTTRTPHISLSKEGLFEIQSLQARRS